MHKAGLLYIDTDILIGILHGKIDLNVLKSRFGEYKSIGTTIINVLELYFGYSQLKYSKRKVSTERLKKERKALEFLIKNLKIAPLTIENVLKSSEIYHRLKSEGKVIDLFDCIIAGIILSTKSFDFLTNNQKHFSRISDLKLIKF